MLCILLGKVLHIYYRGSIFASEIKTNTTQKQKTMATKINAADVKFVMTFNADPFVASDEYG